VNVRVSPGGWRRWKALASPSVVPWFSLKATQQNTPEVLTVDARDQERFIGETSAVVVMGNVAGLVGARGDDKFGLKGHAGQQEEGRGEKSPLEEMCRVSPHIE